jgi:hypothetical protein
MDDDEQINMIMRQTDYTKEISEQKLKEHNNDIMSVMREYMGPSKISSKPASSKFSVNQQIFKEIRGMMDDASRTYQNKKEKEEKIKMEMEMEMKMKHEYDKRQSELLEKQNAESNKDENTNTTEN